MVKNRRDRHPAWPKTRRWSAVLLIRSCRVRRTTRSRSFRFAPQPNALLHALADAQRIPDRFLSSLAAVRRQRLASHGSPPTLHRPASDPHNPLGRNFSHPLSRSALSPFNPWHSPPVTRVLGTTRRAAVGCPHTRRLNVLHPPGTPGPKAVKSKIPHKREDASNPRRGRKETRSGR